MKKEVVKNSQENRIQLSSDKVSRILLIGVVVLYTISLILLADLALAGESNIVGVLVKFNNKMDRASFYPLGIDVKSAEGNILAIDIPRPHLGQLNGLNGICDTHSDSPLSRTTTTVGKQKIISRYSGSNVVVGVLDNTWALSLAERNLFDKTEESSNVGFISFISSNPSSTVIMRNLLGGESNLVQALSYMRAYARTIEKPLVVELIIGEAEMQNPLFVQICQKMTEEGVQFIGSGVDLSHLGQNTPLQFAFSTYDTATGQVSDRSEFWALDEVMGQQLALVGSDGNKCVITVNSEHGFCKIHVSNASQDMIMVTTLDGSAKAHYFSIENKETALIPRTLFNGMTVLEDGNNGIYPFYSRMVVFNDAEPKNQLITLNATDREVKLRSKNEMDIHVSGSSVGRTLSMRLMDPDEDLTIELRDKNGSVVYQNIPDERTKSILAKIDLSDGMDGLYFLDLTSPQYHQTFTLMID